MWLAIKQFFMGRAFVWILMAIVSAGGVAWFQVNYAPRHELKALEATLVAQDDALDAKDAEIAQVIERAKKNRDLYRDQLQRANTLDRAIDQWRDELKRIDDAHTTQWRNADVPGAVSQRLRDIPAE